MRCTGVAIHAVESGGRPAVMSGDGAGVEVEVEVSGGSPVTPGDGVGEGGSPLVTPGDGVGEGGSPLVTPDDGGGEGGGPPVMAGKGGGMAGLASAVATIAAGATFARSSRPSQRASQGRQPPVSLIEVLCPNRTTRSRPGKVPLAPATDGLSAWPAGK